MQIEKLSGQARLDEGTQSLSKAKFLDTRAVNARPDLWAACRKRGHPRNPAPDHLQDLICAATDSDNI